MCSTPQKQPDANVAFCVFSGKFCIDSGSELKARDVDDVKGRRKRERKDGIADGLKAMEMPRREMVMRKIACGESFRMTVPR